MAIKQKTIELPFWCGDENWYTKIGEWNVSLCAAEVREAFPGADDNIEFVVTNRKPTDDRGWHKLQYKRTHSGTRWACTSKRFRDGVLMTSVSALLRRQFPKNKTLYVCCYDVED